MPTLSDQLARAFRVEKILEHADRYLAHLPRKEKENSQLPETLGEHMHLVLGIAQKICKSHELDAIVGKLVDEIVVEIGFEQPEIAASYLLELFADAIAFHDFGKTNEFFQVDKMKNSDPVFRQRVPEIFNPRSGHSELGAFIFSIFHLEKINGLDIPETEKVKLSALTLLFSNTILLHHSPKLVMPQERVSRSQFLEKREKLEKYIRLYRGFPTADVANFYFDSLREVFSEFEETPVGFALFALLRLNFSLLTAADYLATGEYSYGLKLENDDHWGIFSEKKRENLINAPRTNRDKAYNIAAFDLFEKIKSGERSFQNPQDASEKNLNTLRTEMAVKVLQTLESKPGERLFYLEAPTGGGKTNLSMLAVAELLRADPRLTKVFYVFPFTTLITQTHRAVKETLLLDDKQIALLHSRAGFQTAGEKTGDDEGDALYGGQRRDFLQNLFALYPFTLVTHVRFFDILKSNRKDDIYLMHRLANSVVVLDELQSYNPRHWDKMAWLLEQYGRFFNIRFILMSATLPRLDSIEAVKTAAGTAMPDFVDLLPEAKSYFQNPNFGNRVTFKFDLLERGELTADDLAVEVLEKSRARAAANEGRVFTIVEFIFKKSATEFRGVLEGFEPFFDEIFVLSGTILESRRREIINFLKRRRKAQGLKILLITTQVVEAGVDIDMDLGFKNVSLIDSDEQLAGRVNRNVGKQDCEVWLFEKDDASVLYGSDFRFQATRELVRNEPDFHREILETKDFEKLYREVFKKIDLRNQSQHATNFHDYLDFFKKTDFPKIADQFKIIDQQTLSVFVPVSLPLEIENQEGEPEPFFNSFELDFLEKAKDYVVFDAGEKTVNGAAVWKLYREILSNPNADFIAKKIEQKVMQGILAKFTFSLFGSPGNRTRLTLFSDPEKNLEDYFYLNLAVHPKIYDVNAGLDEGLLKNPDPTF